MHLLNVLSLSITIIHSWNRKQACLCLQWFQNEADHSITFLSCYLNVHVCIFYIFAGWSTVWWRKIENSVREKNLISFFHFTCHNIPRITTVSCWVLTLWKLLFLYLQYLVLQVYKLSLFLDRVLAVLPSMPEALAYSWAVAHLRTLDISQGLGEKSVDLWYLAAKSQT